VQVDGVVCTWLRYLRSWVVAWLQSTRSRSELALGHRADSGRPVDQEFSRARSLSAVSEAPPKEKLGVETLCRGASDTAT
jgi:hypothetical protein